LDDEVARPLPAPIAPRSRGYAGIAAQRPVVGRDGVPPPEVAAPERWRVDVEELRQGTEAAGERGHLRAQDVRAAVIPVQAQDAELRCSGRGPARGHA